PPPTHLRTSANASTYAFFSYVPSSYCHHASLSFFLYSYATHRDLHSFPTRRSSDLKKFRVGIKSNISTNRNNLISGVDRCIHLNAMKKTTITSINRQTIKI